MPSSNGSRNVPEEPSARPAQDFAWKKNLIEYAPIRVNSALASFFKNNLESLGNFELDPLPPPQMGPSDVGNANYKTPTIHPEIKMGPPDVSAHTHVLPKWRVGQQAEIRSYSGPSLLP